jgi:radical SAM superfamily enzyme YgiQ (UPF0313 family)
MRFLVVIPKNRYKVGIHYDFPLGLSYISSSLKSKGYQVDCLNLNYYESIETALKKAIKENNSDIICTGGLSVHFTKIESILKIAKNIKPDIMTIIGGGLISSEPKLMIETLKPDFGVVGEGEETIVELADAIIHSKDFSKIDGVIYYNKDKKEIIMNKPRRPIGDIDSIPYPDYDGFEVKRYLDMQKPTDDHYLYPYDKPRMLPIISSRSCPYDCTFCYHPLGKQYRERSLDAFFKEVEYLIEKYNINLLVVMDELFAVRPERVKEFCERIKRYNLKWIAQMRVDGVTEETVNMLKDSGCFQISYGIESACDTILKSMKKRINISQIENALELTYKAKIGIQGNFIFGDKAETWETANQTLQWWLNNRKYQINLGKIIPYPGTQLYYNALEEGRIKDKISFIKAKCPPLNLTKMSDKQFLQLSRLIQSYDTKYNKLPARILLCKKEGVDPYKGILYTIKVECPHCHKVIEYKNMPKSDIGALMTTYGCRIGCRECNQRFDLLTFVPFILKVRRFINNFLTLLPYNRLFFSIYYQMENHIAPSILRFFRNLKTRFTKTIS